MAKNELFMAPFEALNDPFEALVVVDGKLFDVVSLLLGLYKGKEFRSDVKSLAPVFNEFVSKQLESIVNKIGVYSLSKTAKDEILWAHYANSHKGFCLEFDLDELRASHLNSTFVVDINYSSRPPAASSIEMFVPDRKINRNVGLSPSTEMLSHLKKLVGSKSLRWKHEQEVRICAFEVGAIGYNPPSLKSIYFGARADRRLIRLVMRLMRGRGLSYFRMKKIEKSYELGVEAIADEFSVVAS